MKGNLQIEWLAKRRNNPMQGHWEPFKAWLDAMTPEETYHAARFEYCKLVLKKPEAASFSIHPCLHYLCMTMRQHEGDLEPWATLPKWGKVWWSGYTGGAGFTRDPAKCLKVSMGLPMKQNDKGQWVPGEPRDVREMFERAEQKRFAGARVLFEIDFTAGSDEDILDRMRFWLNRWRPEVLQDIFTSKTKGGDRAFPVPSQTTGRMWDYLSGKSVLHGLFWWYAMAEIGDFKEAVEKKRAGKPDAHRKALSRLLSVFSED